MLSNTDCALCVIDLQISSRSVPVNLQVSRQFNSASLSSGCSGTGFCDDSVLQRPTTPKTIERTTLSSPCWKSTSRHLSPNNSLCLKPVDAANRTSVRSRRSRCSIKALISAAVSTSGALRRLAPWRTNRMGLQSNNSYRHAWLNKMDMMFRILARDDRATGIRRSHPSTSTALISSKWKEPHPGLTHLRI